MFKCVISLTWTGHTTLPTVFQKMADLPHWGWCCWDSLCVCQGVTLLNKVWQVWWHRDILQQGAVWREQYFESKFIHTVPLTSIEWKWHEAEMLRLFMKSYVQTSFSCTFPKWGKHLRLIVWDEVSDFCPKWSTHVQISWTGEFNLRLKYEPVASRRLQSWMVFLLTHKIQH